MYTAKFFLTWIQVSNGISPPNTKIDSIIRDSTWISEFARLDFGQLGYPSCPRTSKFCMRTQICARTVKIVHGTLYKFVRMRICCSQYIQRIIIRSTIHTPSAFISHIIIPSSCRAPLLLHAFAFMMWFTILADKSGNDMRICLLEGYSPLSRYTVLLLKCRVLLRHVDSTRSILSVCSGDHDSGVSSDVGWATTHSKSGNGKVIGTLNLWKNKEPVKKVIWWDWLKDARCSWKLWDWICGKWDWINV